MVGRSKPVGWIGSIRKDLKSFPEEVQKGVGFALYQAQMGRKHGSAKPLHGFDGAGVLEIVEDFDSDTYRAVYTVRFAEIVYVLHCFQKKSKTGDATGKQVMELINARLRLAQQEYGKWKLK